VNKYHLIAYLPEELWFNGYKIKSSCTKLLKPLSNIENSGVLSAWVLPLRMPIWDDCNF